MEDLNIDEFSDFVESKLEINNKDDSLLTLKGHFLCEELLTSYIELLSLSPSYLGGSNLSFMHKLNFARALSNEEINNSWHWDCMKKINSIRNKYAHLEKDKERIEKLKLNLVSSVTNNIKPTIFNAHGNAYKSSIRLTATGMYSAFKWVRDNGTT